MKKVYLLTAGLLAMAGTIFSQSKTAAVKFDGVDDHVVIPHTSDLALGRSPFTIEVWIRADIGNIGTAAPAIISKKTTGSSSDGWVIGMDDKGKMAFQMKGQIFPPPGPGGWGAPGVSAIDLRNGQCNHIAWTREVGGVEDTVNGYQNAAYVKNTRKAAGTVNLNGTEDLWFGWSEFNSSPDIWQYSGEIKEVRIWNVAKTESEIFSGRTKHLNGNEPNLIAYWRMNENTGSLVYECVKGNDGTFTNGPTWSNNFCDNLSNAAPAKCTSGPVGIENVSSQASIQLYPNPISNEIQLTSPGSIVMDEVTIYDLNGKTVLRTNWTGMDPLNISDLNSGTYLINLTNEGNQVYKAMITKE